MADELLQMFQSITTSDHDELVDQFAYLLELDHDTATFFLESSNWNVEVAVNTYLATMEAQDGGYSSSRMADDDDDALYVGSANGDSQQQQSDDLDMDADADASSRSQQQQPAPALHAQFVSDLSASQTAVFPPGAVVNMLWSFVNASDCAWPEATHLVFAQGESFNGPQQIPVRAAPHERIEIHATLRMPTVPGAYAGSWRLRSPHGFFGDPVWVVLHVGAAATPSAFEPALQDASKLPFQHHGAPGQGFSNGMATAVGGGSGHSGLGNNEIEDMDL